MSELSHICGLRRVWCSSSADLKANQAGLRKITTSGSVCRVLLTTLVNQTRLKISTLWNGRNTLPKIKGNEPNLLFKSPAIQKLLFLAASIGEDVYHPDLEIL